LGKCHLFLLTLNLCFTIKLFFFILFFLENTEEVTGGDNDGGDDGGKGIYILTFSS
jgi:hypothetical protein